MMKRFGKSFSPSEAPHAGGPDNGIVFKGMRLLFVVSLSIVGLVGPALLVIAGLSGGNRVPAVFGSLTLSLVLGVGTMIFAGQKKLRWMMRRLAERTGLTLSETPDLVPGLSRLSLAGEIQGRWTAIAFENLPVAGTTEYVPGGGKWHISRKRQHLVASVRVPPNRAGEKGEWLDLSLPNRITGPGEGLSEENENWLRERRCRKFQLGGGRAAMAWDATMTEEGLDEAVRGMSLLIELADRLESGGEAKGDSAATCPLCRAPLPFNPRYLRAVCSACVRRACDAEGRLLDFYNTDFGGGYRAVYREGGEEYNSHDCFIDGYSCRADEARFGGIVVQMCESDLSGRFTRM